MRTNIEIDDELIHAALGVNGLKTKRAAVEEGLRLLIRLKRQGEVRGLFGQVRWEGDLDKSRAGRVPPGYSSSTARSGSISSTDVRRRRSTGCCRCSAPSRF